ncbi:MAG: biotin/lipoyl-binding protein [Prevotella bivia]|jgi:hypothetical protein|uniref:Multidrug resistance efflux pump n=1 Tax=Prevotella bivia DSM 20514 TaxID=868129 RepID=I4Z6X8_9BACT|nr:biotin/lipoyl-binding protein [Prevotella bivia]EFB93594.1 auxiliary transport protein, membrane fusion protein (MFP) family protein [Prevotella bivia JCVIHMP010]EIM31970.1 multidrug resistance efflux pump [Prevotella bivia DSM 20514]KGF22160.1 hemolysin secretion protein D [Prevotella bivia DNF00188]KGF34850.1 hemolysin secretion protein D [Prevotella bivia DNF00650]KXU55911.1 auxiliary transport protein, membrane fusion protein family protein [Prevotella bivia]
MSAKSQKRNIFLAVLSFAAVVVTAGLIGHFTMSKPKEVIQGEVEVGEYRVACKLPGRITSIKVKEGDFVHKGDILAILAIPEANAQEKVAEAAAGATDALSELTAAPTRKEAVDAAYQVYQQTIAARNIAEKTYNRMQRLYDEGVMSAQKKDEALAAFETTKAGVEVAKSNWELLKKGARNQAKEAAKKQAQAAKSAIDVVKSILKETVQRATADGEVSEIYPKEGELVGFGSPIMSILLTNDISGTFNIREDQLEGMKIGTTFRAFVPALNREITMVVTSMKDEGAYAVWKATKTNGQYDLKTFEVKAKPTTKVKGLLKGMSLIMK